MSTDRFGSKTLLIAAVLAAGGGDSYAAEAQRVSAADKEGHCQRPEWSPDGKMLSFERSFLDRPKRELYVLEDIDTKPVEHRVAPALPHKKSSLGGDGGPADGDVCHELAWGPKDGIFAFACNVEGASYQLFFRDKDEPYNRGLRLTYSSDAVGHAVFGDGWQLAYVATRGGREAISLVGNVHGALPKRDKGLEPSKVGKVPPEPGRLDRAPVWSPGGDKLAFVGHSSATGGDIFIATDTDKPKPNVLALTNWPDEETNPSWSPDGTRIAFYSNKGSKKKRGEAHKNDKDGSGIAGYNIYVVEAKEGAKPFRLVENVIAGEGRGPSWTRDGAYIVYIKDLQKNAAVVNPIRAIAVKKGAKELALKTGTISNDDVHVVERNGEWWATFAALGTVGAAELKWRGVYIFPLAELKAGNLPVAAD